MKYVVTCVDYVAEPDEKNPVRVRVETCDTYLAAHHQMTSWENEFQRVDLGRHIVIKEEGTNAILEANDFPPCNDDEKLVDS